MARAIIQPINLAEERIRPVAAPVSTYVRPPEPASSPLHETAQALSRFSQSLGSLVGKRKQEQEDRDKIMGQAAAVRANGIGYAEAVRQGIIGPTNSPLFIEAFEETQGSIIGKRLASKAMTAYQTWEGRNSDDPNDFDNFVGQFMRDNLTSNNPNVLRGALPYVQNVSNTLYTANTNERNDNLYRNSVNANIASSSMDIDAFDDAWLMTGEEQDYGQLWSNLMRQRELALGSGIRGEDYDEALVAMIQSKSLEHMDPNLLGMLRNQVPGQSYKYSDTVSGQRVMNSTIESLEARWAKIEAEKAAAQKENDRKQKDATTAYIIDQLATDPNTIFDAEFIRQAQVLDPELPIRVRQWQAEFAKGEPEDAEAILRIQEAILNGAGLEAITSQLGPQGAIRDPSTLVSLNNLVKSVSSSDMDKITGNQAVKDSLAWIQKRFTDDMMLSIDPSSASVDAIAARTDFTNSMIAWLAANPNATYDQVSTQATVVLKRIQDAHPEGTGTEYGRPDELQEIMATPPANIQGQPNVEQVPGTTDTPTVLTPSQAERAAAEEAEAGDPVTDPWQGDAPPRLEQLEESQRQRIIDRAHAAGLDPEVVIQQLFNNQRLRAQPQQQSLPAPAPLTTGTATGDGGGEGMAGVLEPDTIRSAMVQRGLPDYIADAFIMNMADESRFNTAINEIAPLVPGSRGGFGLLQWTGPRRRELEAFAQARGLPVDDLGVQLDFLMHELATTESAAAKKIFAATTPQEAAVAIVNHFLRPAESHRASRSRKYRNS